MAGPESSRVGAEREADRGAGRRRLAAIGVLSLTGLALLALLACWRPPLERLWGDEGTYLAMTASLARDRDLAFGDADHAWARERPPGPPVTVILQQTGRGITYSKPLLYPLLAAPFYAVAGEGGMVAANLVLLAAGLGLVWPPLRRQLGGAMASALLATFTVCGAVLPYLEWRMSEAAQLGLALGGLALALGGLPRPGNRRPERGAEPGDSLGRVAAGGLLLGALVTMRFPNAALAAVPALAAALCGRWRRAVVTALFLLAGFGAVSGLSVGLLGTANPYKAVRSSFDGATGYPAGAGGEAALERFEAGRSTVSLGLQPDQDWTRSAYAALYFLIGRHTGLLAYLPLALLLAALALAAPDRVGAALLCGVAGVALFHLVWMPDNYFGGATFLGNRYFLPAYAALLLAPRRAPRWRSLGAVWAVGLAAGLSAAVSVAATRGLDASSQSHSAAGLFRWLPHESVARQIDGEEKRFWGRDFVRFVDPWAEVGEWTFRLESGRPPAELQVATNWPGTPLRLLVTPDRPGVELEVADWRRRRRLPVDSSGAGPGAGSGAGPKGLVEFEPAAAWRRHRFWWHAEALYDVRAYRLALRHPDGGPVGATVRYAGRVLDLGLPLTAATLELRVVGETVAGGTTPVRIALRNTGRWPWTPEAALPVRLGYRVRPASGGAAVARGRGELAAEALPGESVRGSLEVGWPPEPGDYLLIVELLREPVTRLGPGARVKLGERRVTVAAAGAGGD